MIGIVLSARMELTNYRGVLCRGPVPAATSMKTRTRFLLRKRAVTDVAPSRRQAQNRGRGEGATESIEFSREKFRGRLRRT